MTDKQILNSAYDNMVENRLRQQTSLSLSPEILSLLEDIRDEIGINRSRIAEHLMWYAIQHGAFDELGVFTHAD